MPTHNPRVNVTMKPSTMDILSFLAKKQHKSLSGMAKELILEAINHREDFYLSSIAEAQEAKSTKTIPHDEAWK
jgi:predicted DNA-binding protein